MSTDHREFIERYHKPVPEPEAKPPPRPRAPVLLMLAITVAYIVLCVVAALALGVPERIVTIAAGVFTVTAIAGFALQRTIHAVRHNAQDRALLRGVLEGSRGARLITDSAEQTVYNNEKFAVLCRPVGEPTLSSLALMFSGDEETKSHFRNLAEQARRGLTDTIELYSRVAEREAWYIVTVQPVAGWAGYIHWRVDDVTDKRSADRAIREEREKLLDFTDNAPVGFFSVDENGRFVFINATMARWLGEGIDTLLNQGRLHHYLVDPPAEAGQFDLTAQGGAKQIVEVRMKGPGGRIFMAAINQTVVREPGGRVRTRAVVHDMTAERAMRQALQDSEDRFQRFFEEAPLGIAIRDSEGILKDCNQALAGMLGTDLQALEGQPFNALLQNEDRHKVMMAMDRIDQGQQMEAPLEIGLRGQGRIVMVQMHARKFKGSGAIVLHFIDLTEQKKLEAQFAQSQKMQAVGQLAGGIAHDFNNLLTAIIGFCDLLLLRHKPGDPSFGDIMQIKQNSNRAANLVRQLLAFSRQQTLQPKVQDITDILIEMSHLLRRLMGANIELEVLHGHDLGLVRVDVGQMEQVLVNLAVNARDAMPQGGRLTITTSSFSNDRPLPRGDDEMPAGRWTALEVADTGCGIPPEIIGRIFEPFFTTKGVGEGTGLGLATVYGIVRQTGAYLHVESVTGVGTTFTIYLPALSEEEAAQGIQARKAEVSEDDAARDLTGTACILLVEDEDAVRTFSTRALTNKGYEVLAAPSGEDALQLMQDKGDKRIDLMVSDVVMPNMDGPTLAQRLRQTNPDLKVIFMSGYTEDKLKDHMGRNTYFLPKPFTLKQLAAKVKDVLDQAAV